MLLLNPEIFDMIINQKKQHQLFAIVDVQKIQYEILHPNKKIKKNSKQENQFILLVMQ